MKRWIRSQTTLITIMLLLSLVMAGGLTFFTSYRSSKNDVTNNSPHAVVFLPAYTITLDDNGGSGGSGSCHSGSSRPDPAPRRGS